MANAERFRAFIESIIEDGDWEYESGTAMTEDAIEFMIQLQAQIRRIGALRRQLASYEAALRFYANYDHYVQYKDGERDVWENEHTEIGIDKGERARYALDSSACHLHAVLRSAIITLCK